MIRIQTYLFALILFAVVAACNTQRQICPAYQSAFIHDSTTRAKMFSYFGEDSLPKVLEANKDRHLLIDPVTLRKKRRMMQTVAMVDVYPQEPDSAAFDDDLLLAERDAKMGDLYDSAALVREMDYAQNDTIRRENMDSVYMISLKKEKFNIDQELYLWYLKKYLVYPDVKLQMEEAAEPQKQGFFKRLFNKNMTDENGEKVGFFRRLFPKKDKKKDKEEEAADDSEVTDDEEGEGKKKGFSLFKKKKKKDKTEEGEDPPAEEEEDTDEDF